MDHHLITTAFTIDGCKIVKNLGVVRGIVVSSRSAIGTVRASFQTIKGGNLSLFTELCEKTRNDSFEQMVAHAEQLGGNGIIGVRYDANAIMEGVTEVLAYGTAVVFEKM